MVSWSLASSGVPPRLHFADRIMEGLEIARSSSSIPSSSLPPPPPPFIRVIGVSPTVTTVTRALLESASSDRMGAQRGFNSEGTLATRDARRLPSQSCWGPVTAERLHASLGDRGGLGAMDRFYRPPEYLQLQALVPRLCLATGATAIGFCSLIYMNAYCGWLLRIHNLRHCFCSVLFGGMRENGSITGGARSPLLLTVVSAQGRLPQPLQD